MLYVDEFTEDLKTVTESESDGIDNSIHPVEGTTPEVTPSQEFLTNSDLDALKFLRMKGQINDIKGMINTMTQESKKILNDDEFSNYLDDQIKDLTSKEIEKLSNDEIEEIYTINDTQINLSIPTPDKKRDIEFKRDYLVFKKKSEEANEKFEQEIAVIENEIAESQEEFDKVMSTFGNVSNVVVERLKTCIQIADSEEKRERFTKYLTAFNNAFTLDNVVKFAESYKGLSILGDFHNDKKSNDVYKRYLKVIKALQLKQDLAQFTNMEKYLPEKYRERPNIFIFTIISMVASWHNKPIERANGLFLSQFSINLKNLIYDHFDSQEEKDAFLQNMMTVIDVRR